MKNTTKRHTKPAMAPGMDDSEELDKKATSEDIEEDDYTKVTKLSFDEVDPS